MNNKNKLLLTSIGLVVLSGIAATSSTFAWFTTTRTASISYSSATVTTSESNLLIKYVSSNNAGTGPLDGQIVANTTDATNSLVLTGVNEITDISGDGVSFYKPIWSATAGTASAINEVLVADGNWVDFTIEITRDNTNPMKVYLGAGTEITPVDAGIPAHVQAVKAARLAVIDDSNAVKFFYAPDATDTAHEYLGVGTTAYGVNGFEVLTSAKPVLNTFTTASTIANANLTGSLIADLPLGTDTVNVTFRAWLEGVDADAINTAIGGVFKIDLKLYGLEA